MITRIDQLTEWSEEDEWRDLNGWRNDRKARNKDTWGYSRYLGQSSPQLDLVTFAESFFVRPRDVTNTKLSADESLQCQEFTRARYLRGKIATIDEGWKRDDFASCPEFEQWANLDELTDIDMLVAAASSEQPESLYGHLLVHVRYEGKSEGFEPVYQFGAVTATDVGMIDYFTRGLLGGFQSVLEISSFRATDRQFLQREQRNLKRFRLNLTEDQQKWMLQRIWELERRHRYPYVFFRNNCASFLYDLVGTSLGLHFNERDAWIISPTDVLDTLAEIENGELGSLLKKRPLSSYSSREIALREIKSRRKTLEALAADDILEKLESKNPNVRGEGSAILFQRLVSLNASFEERLEPLYQTVQIEKYFAEVARSAKKGIQAKRIKSPPQFTAAEVLERRRELYREEKLEKRYEKILAFADQMEKRIENSELRDPTKKELKTLDWADETLATYDLAVSNLGDFIEQKNENFDAVAFLEKKESAFQEASAARDERSTGPSGMGRFSAGWGYELHSDAVGDHVMTRVGIAFIKEKLGEQRRRGFRSDIESVALDFRLQVPIVEKAFRRFDLDLTIFRFLSATTRVGPVRRTFFDRFGWMVDLGVTRRGRYGVFGLLYGSGGLVLPIVSSDGFANFLIAGVAVDARLGQLQTSQELMGGGYAFLRHQLHLYGNYANVLEVEVSSHHHFTLPSQQYLHSQQGRLGTQHALFFVGQHPLLARPFGSIEYSNFAFPEFETRIDATFGVDIELPL